ncbi:RhoGEF domain containing protein [Tritrichomonas foetus]|uniref:RhoGEF domain containing protein n=1 Tax=Tritrichomonas foetus TaxID=1144522 RepID=A0A1J4KB45_9EUKA|nr:RhoGEF domain containing protein [Tritrichomonas foetus]|eukprot:OHT06916.1 RhoGEF domain containing protein [Tritrichomonas foetus]
MLFHFYNSLFYNNFSFIFSKSRQYFFVKKRKRKMSGKGRRSGKQHKKQDAANAEDTAVPELNEKEQAAAKTLTPAICKFLMKMTNDAKRRRIICEMIETERNYVNSLCICEEVYYQPLDQSITSTKPLIDSATMGQLFGNIDQIREAHQSQILKHMDEALPYLKKPFPAHKIYNSIATAFIEVIPRLQQLYTVYLSSNANYEATLKKLKKNKRFNKFLNKALFNPRSKCQEIEDLLILPTQRIAGYKLLFERVIKYFPIETHPEEHKLFSQAYDNLLIVGKEMNSEKGDDKGSNELLNISENLSKAPPFFCLMKPGRRYLGPFRPREIDPVKGRLSKGNVKNYIVFVLSDILLITYKASNSTFSSNKLIYVDAVPFTQVHFSLFPLEKYIENAVTLKTDTQEYHFYVKKKEDLDQFVMGVKKTKKQIRAKVKAMSEGGKDYMLNMLNQLKSGYLEPKPLRSRKDALAAIK